MWATCASTRAEKAFINNTIIIKLAFNKSLWYYLIMFIKRDILDVLKGHLSKQEISLIVGPRQAGKTTVMKAVQEYVKGKGERTIFLSLDFDRDRPFFRSQDTLVQRIRLEFGNNKGYVFIDEVQRKEDAGLFLKGLYDMALPCKFIVSGSGSIELKEKIHESLLGRKRLFELYTLSLKEFANYRTGYHYEGRLSEFFRIDREGGMALFMEYVNYGGYPRVVLETEFQEKEAVIDEIFRTYVERDISFLLNVERPDAFKDMMALLADQTGQMINLHSLSIGTGVAFQTLKKYLSYAEKTFTIKMVSPFFSNVRKEIRKSPVVYFTDLGLRNYSIGRFGRYRRTSNMGFLFQNLVFLILLEWLHRQRGDIHYWRTKDGAEVGFVFKSNGKIIPVECKSIDLKSPIIGRSLRRYIERYRPDEAWVVNLGLRRDVRINNTIVRLLPFYELIE